MALPPSRFVFIQCKSFYPTEQWHVSFHCAAARKKSLRYQTFRHGLFFRAMLH